MKNSLYAGIVASFGIIFLSSCGSDESESGMVQAKASFFNGPTLAATSLLSYLSAHRAQVSTLAISDGTWLLTPQKMTVEIQAIGMSKAGEDQQTGLQAVEGCVVTYDQSKPSLTRLLDCPVSIPTGTYEKITIKMRDTYHVLFDGTDGIYSSNSFPHLISDSAPAAGAEMVDIVPNIHEIDWVVHTTYFAEPLTITADSEITISVLFDPTHVSTASASGGSFTSTPTLLAPTLYPVLGNFGKVAYYTNAPSGKSLIDSNYFGFLVLYDSNNSPIYLTTTEKSADPCQPANTIDSFPVDGNKHGTFGYLGANSSRTLSWAFAGDTTIDANSYPIITGYRGVYSMSEKTTVGEAATVSYDCTTSVPTPASGKNYSSGAPTFTADSTISLTLRAD